ncbi:MAG TPA: hypothetical protein VK457_20340 [Chloroflexota bacterium]|jgi:uncharacterized membrane protein YkvA (DUF1232 family)|nr:hypothetical protein [Chloroflexota bacterium]
MIERLKTLIHLPGQLLLCWRLFRDPRVPVFSKLIAAGGILLVLSPLDVFEWLPLGGIGSLALLAVVLRSFINAAPEDVRAQHMALLGMRSG